MRWPSHKVTSSQRTYVFNIHTSYTDTITNTVYLSYRKTDVFLDLTEKLIPPQQSPATE